MWCFTSPKCYTVLQNPEAHPQNCPDFKSCISPNHNVTKFTLCLLGVWGARMEVWSLSVERSLGLRFTSCNFYFTLKHIWLKHSTGFWSAMSVSRLLQELVKILHPTARNLQKRSTTCVQKLTQQTNTTPWLAAQSGSPLRQDPNLVGTPRLQHGTPSCWRRLACLLQIRDTIPQSRNTVPSGKLT